MGGAKVNWIDQHAAGMRRVIWIGLLLLLVAAPAQAKRIVQIRVGNHPTFTRLVFEMDVFTGYQVERRVGTDGTEQITVTLDASTPSREIKSKSVGIDSVSVVERAGQAIAQIRLRKSGFPMKEMILSNPPRIVLDFVHSAAVVTQDSHAKSTPVEPPVREEPAPDVVRPDPKPVVTKAIVPEPAVEPEPVVAKIVQPEPAIEPEPEPVVTEVVQPEPVVAEAVVPESEFAADEIAILDPTMPPDDAEPALSDAAERHAALRAATPGVHKRDDLKPSSDPTAELTSEPIADVADADFDAPQGSSTRALTPSTGEAQRRIPAPPDVTRRIEKPKPADGGLPFDRVTMAGIAVGVLIVLVVAVRLFRKKSLSNDLDDAPSDGTVDFDRGTRDRIPAEGLAINDSSTGGPAPQVEEQNTAAYSLSEVAANRSEPETGLYNEDSEGEKPMDMETTNLPTERKDFVAPPAAAVSSGGSDMSQLVQELASRITSLETRFDEVNDSRERLERQVAAQSEELRVQRAAIARTQRALRSLSRSEEDQATEPALRESSQPTR